MVLLGFAGVLHDAVAYVLFRLSHDAQHHRIPMPYGDCGLDAFSEVAPLAPVRLSFFLQVLFSFACPHCCPSKPNSVFVSPFSLSGSIQRVRAADPRIDRDKVIAQLERVIFEIVKNVAVTI